MVGLARWLVFAAGGGAGRGPGFPWSAADRHDCQTGSVTTPAAMVDRDNGAGHHADRRGER